MVQQYIVGKYDARAQKVGFIAECRDEVRVALLLEGKYR
jgi:hypothetical protein